MRLAERVPQQQLLEAGALPARAVELQRARTQPADRAGRDFEHEHALLVDAALRVNGPVVQPERLAAPPRRVGAICGLAPSARRATA